MWAVPTTPRSRPREYRSQLLLSGLRAGIYGCAGSKQRKPSCGTIGGVTPTVISCHACGQSLTRPVEQMAELPEPYGHGNADGRTLPVGTWAVDPEPVGWIRDAATSSLGCLVINPGDALDLEPHPDDLRNGGCCGHDGCDGHNRLCPSCHAEVATLRDDCWTPVELRFEPSAVDARPVLTGEPG
jgi:hypothetical protein